MCGRFVRFSPLDVLLESFEIDAVDCGDIGPRYNIAPTTEILAIIHEGGKRLVKLFWGLIPAWAKDRSIGNRLINARAETAAQKPSFRSAFKRRRCLILADGFYEWKGAMGAKQPYFIALPAGGPMAFAGLWETWKDRQSGIEYRTCAILTTDAGKALGDIHSRMPVILRPEAHDDWIDPENQNPEHLARLLSEKSVRDLQSYPVSTRVNSARNNDPALIEKT